MSTTFGVKIEDEVIPVARRSGIGNGRVGINFTNKLAKLLPLNTPVEPIDNSAQGVKTIGDLFFLEKHGTFNVEINGGNK